MHQWSKTGIKTFMFGGEEPPSHIERVARAPPDASFWNLYGLTECSVWSSCVPIQPGQNRTPISRSPADIAPGHSFRIERDQLIISCAQPCSLGNNSDGDGVVELSDVEADHVERLIDDHIYFVSRIGCSFKRHGRLVSLSAIRAQLFLCVKGLRGDF
jgi:acyl-CoA synthetase (AMP-forming)/AMP-acid ligase II